MAVKQKHTEQKQVDTYISITLVQQYKEEELPVFQQRSFQWNPEIIYTCLPVSDSVPIAKVFSALSPEYFMTDSKHNIQFKDTDGFVTWVCNSHGYDICCQWKHLWSRNYF